MKKIVNGQLIELTSQEIEIRENEILTAEAVNALEKPYNALNKLDNELPRWAEDIALHTGAVFQGRALDVLALKLQYRTEIQEREL